MYNDLKFVREVVYQKCGFDFGHLQINKESTEYSACSFTLNGIKVLYRSSKITPTKTGQFVTIWKRNEEGITEPFDVTDDFDYLVITSASENNLGQFIFPKQILAQNGIISQSGKEGKRGIRLYPPWGLATNKQAKKTQSWQLKYFLKITGQQVDLKRAKALFQYA